MGLVGLKQAPRDIKQAPLLAFVLMSGQKKKKRKHTYELGQSEVPFYPAKRHSWDFREHQKKKTYKQINLTMTFMFVWRCSGPNESQLA